jgi:phosphoadenosine phosphosulfate reductase
VFDLSVTRRASEKVKEVILLFSGGKDSIASLDLACKHFGKVVPVHFYYIKGLRFRENHLNYYARKYGVEIIQFPRCEDLSRQINEGTYQAGVGKKVPKIRQWEMDLYIRRKLNIEWIIYGYKRQDSLQRRGIMNANCLDGEEKYTGGIDARNHKIYPLANWSNKEVFTYLKMKKLPLSCDYFSGFRDINTFKGEPLLWLYNNYPEDYETVRRQFPLIEAALMRAKDGIR